MRFARTIWAWRGLPEDAQWAIRSLSRRPMFTASVVLMLGVGIGLNAAIFTVVDAALFKGFRHVQRNDRLVRVSTTKDTIFYPDFEAWRSQSLAHWPTSRWSEECFIRCRRATRDRTPSTRPR
jgi:hypothetical protein